MYHSTFSKIKYFHPLKQLQWECFEYPNVLILPSLDRIHMGSISLPLDPTRDVVQEENGDGNV